MFIVKIWVLSTYGITFFITKNNTHIMNSMEDLFFSLEMEFFPILKSNWILHSFNGELSVAWKKRYESTSVFSSLCFFQETFDKT